MNKFKFGQGFGFILRRNKYCCQISFSAMKSCFDCSQLSMYAAQKEKLFHIISLYDISHKSFTMHISEKSYD